MIVFPSVRNDSCLVSHLFCTVNGMHSMSYIHAGALSKPRIPSSVFIPESSMVDKNIYIVQGEISTVVGAIKRNSRWNTHTPLVSALYEITILFADLSELRLAVLKLWTLKGRLQSVFSSDVCDSQTEQKSNSSKSIIKVHLRGLLLLYSALFTTYKYLLETQEHCGPFALCIKMQSVYLDTLSWWQDMQLHLALTTVCHLITACIVNRSDISRFQSCCYAIKAHPSSLLWG